MHEIGVFSDWVAEGAAFGVKAFFALIVFAIICAAVFGLVEALAYVARGQQNEDKR